MSTSEHGPRPERTVARATSVARAGRIDPIGHCVGRVWLPPSMCPAGIGGPTPVVVRPDGIYDLTAHVATVADLLDHDDALAIVADSSLPRLAALDEVLAAATLDPPQDPSRLSWLAPIDLQVIKACGVTFAASALERVIEERAKGDAARSAAIRAEVEAAVGADLRSIRPGGEAATRLKDRLIADSMWSQYLEVAIGPDAEVFTKAPVLAAVGTGDWIGIRRASRWNNSEPEAVLVMDARNHIRAATLGNDMNLRDFEGRSALLLGEAKDANGSCSIGPWLRLFEPDGAFTIEALLASPVRLSISGADGFRLEGENRLAEISRSPQELVRQAGGESHAYPDGYALFLGTMFVPTAERDEPGAGFRHLPGDVVSISNPHLGQLVNVVGIAEDIPRWSFGIRDLWRSVAARRLPRGTAAG